MTQTAVEWYGVQIGILISKFFNNEISKSEVHFKRIEIEEQAKEMDKQQLEKAFNESRLTHPLIGFKHETFHNYYNETYKNLNKMNEEDLEYAKYYHAVIRPELMNDIVVKGEFVFSKDSVLLKEDSIVNEVVSKFKSRSNVGIKKYGVTLDREDLTTIQWIEHAIEEQMDSILYLTRIKKDLESKK